MGSSLRRLSVVAAGAACAVVSGGCVNGRIGGPEGRAVSLSEFSQTTSPQAEVKQAKEAQEPDEAVGIRLMAGTDPGAIETAIDDDREVLRPTRPGERVIVDSLVGHINGRPVFADEFLEPIEDRLLRAAEERTGLERQQVFRAIIDDWLKDVVTNELILAEAEASLTVQQQQGLFALLRMLYEEEIRRGGGTRSGAEQRRRRSGDDLDQYLGRQKHLVLIDRLRVEKIEPRVIVSWRDIEREYKRREKEFSPPAAVTLARIRLNTAMQADLIDDVNERLAAGESFGKIAEELGFANRGVWETFEMGPAGLTGIEVSEPMKEALAGLDAGDTSAPFALGSGTVWLHVVEITRPVARSIYDPEVQIMLKNMIRNRRSQAEWVRYVNSLLDRGIYDELDQMADRLYRIALDRYAR